MAGPYNIPNDMSPGDPGQIDWAVDVADAVNDLDVRANVGCPVIAVYGTVGSYLPSWASNGTSTGVFGSWLDTMLAHPVVFEKTYTADRVAINVTSAGSAGSKVDLAIYADDGNHHPGALLATLTTGLATDSTGNKEATISFIFEAGRKYWIGYIIRVASFTATRFGVENYIKATTSIDEVFSMVARNGGEGPLGGTGGAPPDPFPGTGYGGAQLCVAFRRAS